MFMQNCFLDIALFLSEQAINERILSLNYEDYTAEIKTADAQESYEKGVIVLVTGCLTGKDNVKRKFTQTFFLAPQDKGYYVLNDVFRYVEEGETLPVDSVPANGINENAQGGSIPVEQGWHDLFVFLLFEAWVVLLKHQLSILLYSQFFWLLLPLCPEPTHAPDHLVVDPVASFGEELDNGAEVCDPSDNEEGSVIEEEINEPPIHSIENKSIPVVESTPEAQEDAPKRSYASIVSCIFSFLFFVVVACVFTYCCRLYFWLLLKFSWR